VDGDVIKGHAALSHQFLHVPVGQPVPQVPATATAITSRGKRKPTRIEDEPEVNCLLPATGKRLNAPENDDSAARVVGQITVDSEQARVPAATNASSDCGSPTSLAARISRA
jgi:hypothetical protein